jgi:hypothetical protein
LIPIAISKGIELARVWRRVNFALKRVLEGVDEGQFGITKGELDRAVKEFAA